MSSNFSLTTASPQVNVIQSINYLLATQGNSVAGNVLINGNVVQTNAISGNVYTNNNGTISYLYGYMDVKYANTSTGGGFTSNCVNQQYFGIHNTATATIDPNPVDYQWTQVSGGFGTTKSLWYTTGGGGTINFAVVTGNAAPTIYYSPVIDNTPIALAVVTNSAVTTTSIQPAAVTNVQIAGNTITANNIQAGTITADKLAANIIFVNQSIQSTNATFDSLTSAGFWLDASNGSARFGGNTSIGNSLAVGNNLTVGNNAVIGGNLTIGGLVTGGNLNINTVTTTNIVTQSVSQGNASSSNTLITITNPTATLPYFYTYANTSINLASTSGISNYITGVLSTDIEFNYTGGGSTQTWNLIFYLYRNNTNVVTQTFRYDVDTVNQSRFNNIVPFAYLDTGLSANTTYTYSMAVSTNPGSTSVPQLLLTSGSLICQVLKR